jgi:hypothetical protein
MYYYRWKSNIDKNLGNRLIRFPKFHRSLPTDVASHYKMASISDVDLVLKSSCEHKLVIV